MTVAAILLPVFVQVALTFAVLFQLGYVRSRALKAGGFDRSNLLIDSSAWPANVRQSSNAFGNQFEIPVLFYALVALALITRKADLAFVVLSWVFVLTRVGHALVHVTSNDLKLRFPLYFLGVIVLMIMWVLFALAILLAPALP